MEGQPPAQEVSQQTTAEYAAADLQMRTAALLDGASKLRNLTHKLVQGEVAVADAQGDLSLLACDLEDMASASHNPADCAHPYWNAKTDGGTACRTCGDDTSHIDPMGR